MLVNPSEVTESLELLDNLRRRDTAVHGLTLELHRVEGAGQQSDEISDLGIEWITHIVDLERIGAEVVVLA
jgi:hypothetical protein